MDRPPLDIRPPELDTTPYVAPEPASLRELPGRLAGLSLGRQVFTLALWPFLEQLLSFLVGAVDLALAGRLSPNALRVSAMDAIAVAGYVAWGMSLTVSAVGIGATALVARAIGGRHKRLASAAVGQAILLALLIGVVIGVVVWSAADLIATAFGLDGQAHHFCALYLRILAAVYPASALLLVGAACLRGAGDTRSPFIAMTFVTLTNMAASVLLVFGPEPIGGRGVAGIAGGTAIAWCLGCVIILAILLTGRGAVRLRLPRLRPHRHIMGRILTVGIPSAVESAGMWLINALVVRIVAGLGVTAALGAHMIAVRVEAISYLPGFALGIAAATLMGQYLGLGDPVRARRAAARCWAVGAAVMSAMGILFLLVPGALVRVVSLAPEHALLAPTLLMICGPVQPMFATYLVLGQALRGAGDTRAVMLLSYPSLLVIRLGGAYLLGVTMGHGLAGVWVALCADLAIKGCLFGARFLRGGWAKVRV